MSESPADSAPPPLAAPPIRRQFGLRSLFLLMTVAATLALAYRLFEAAVLPAILGVIVGLSIHFLAQSIRDDEQRQVAVLGGYTLVAWLTASVLLKHLSSTDRLIAAGSIPAAVIVVWGLCRWWSGGVKESRSR